MNYLNPSGLFDTGYSSMNSWGSPLVSNAVAGIPSSLFEGDSAALSAIGDQINAQPGISIGNQLKGILPGFLTDGSAFNKRLGDGTQVQGWGAPALGALATMGSGFLAMKQYGLAKDQFNFQKNAYNQNYAAQRQATNAQLEDRQRARVASNAGAYQSVGDYMNQYGIK